MPLSKGSSTRIAALRPKHAVARPTPALQHVPAASQAFPRSYVGIAGGAYAGAVASRVVRKAEPQIWPEQGRATGLEEPVIYRLLYEALYTISIKLQVRTRY